MNSEIKEDLLTKNSSDNLENDKKEINESLQSDESENNVKDSFKGHFPYIYKQNNIRLTI